MEYVICIQTDFGELKVDFETDGILKHEGEVFDIALEKIQESGDVKLTGLLARNQLFFDVTEGKTLECM